MQWEFPEPNLGEAPKRPGDVGIYCNYIYRCRDLRACEIGFLFERSFSLELLYSLKRGPCTLLCMSFLSLSPPARHTLVIVAADSDAQRDVHSAIFSGSCTTEQVNSTTLSGLNPPRTSYCSILGFTISQTIITWQSCCTYFRGAAIVKSSVYIRSPSCTVQFRRRIIVGIFC